MILQKKLSDYTCFDKNQKGMGRDYELVKHDAIPVSE